MTGEWKVIYGRTTKLLISKGVKLNFGKPVTLQAKLKITKKISVLFFSD
jgi:hypothetical protein